MVRNDRAAKREDDERQSRLSQQSQSNGDADVYEEKSCDPQGADHLHKDNQHAEGHEEHDGRVQHGRNEIRQQRHEQDAEPTLLP